ncbi:hypothetical protein BDP27DRAFT_1316209 [Rhodocollybia butyracea]|uniref:Uncharacterized protein n=1 Tax=Rhodocollybia butyracea TaxID=206335 RepID=A0A9P5Q3S8_9AGAR|nr:hypothetical protein BDP27DRAFT_1316209 [Rhodocollybia butyracea]
MCADCGYMPTTTSATLPTAGADDTVDPSPTSDESASQSAFIASLPPGWKLELSQEKHATVIVILTVSLSLAFTICFVIICSVIWRKRTKRTRDVEKRPPKGTVGDNVHAVVEKEIKMKQKVLAKATARWKANARYTFRQRRGKRRTIQQHSDSELDLSPTLPSVIETPASERSSLSLVCSEPVVHDDAPLDAADERECTADERPPPPLQLSSPPAYPIQSIDHTLLHPGSYHPRSTPSSPSSNLQSRRTSVSSLTSEMCSEHQSLTYRPHLMAHLATDDKTVLEQLNQLSSAPEGSGILSSSVFAPVWRDEELSDFVHRRDPTSTVGTSDSHSDPYSQSSNFDAMPFPSPPTSKGKELDHYSYSYHSDRPYGSLYEYDQGFLDVEPDAGPSAPPFEPSAPDEGPSAPPFEPQNTISHSHQPSAPFLLTDETNSTHSQEDSLTEPVCTLDLVHTGEESQAHDHEMMP